MTMKQRDVQGSCKTRRRYLACLPCILLLLQCPSVLGSTSREQTIFEASPSQKIATPVPLPDTVVQILTKDNDVVECLKDNPIPRGRSLASWFSASEVHLNGSNESDLVVLPVVQGGPYMCFHSTEGIGWFWIFRQTGERYQLVLKTAGLSLILQHARHNGYKDIQSEGLVGAVVSRASFRFENGSYREYRRKTEDLR